MKSSLKAGLKASHTQEIDAQRAIHFLGEGLHIYSTPWLVQDVEQTYLDLAQLHLDDGESTVGIGIAIKQLAGTPVGMSVHIDVELIEVERRRLTFDFKVRDNLEPVAEGRHQRFAIDVERQIAHIRDKIDKAKVR